MQKELYIGTANGKPFTLPQDAVTHTIGILARRGAGKTNTAVCMVEELDKCGLQVVVIDPLDVWHGIRSSADGTREGRRLLIAGGEHGDIPLEVSNGEVLADFIVERGISAVLSIRHLSMTEQRSFVTQFLERVYRKKGQQKYRSPLQIVLDEADEFAPQNVDAGAARMVGAVDRIVRRGRASGLGVTLISQRAAALNKNCLTQIDVLIALGTSGPQDIKALKDWIAAHDVDGKGALFLKSVATLKIGEAWIWSPSWLNVFERVNIRRRETFDSSATPKVGDRPVEPKNRAPIDLKEITEQLQSTIKENKENDPKELQKRIKELEQQLANKATPKVANEILAQARAEGTRDGAAEVYNRWIRDRQRIIESLRHSTDELITGLEVMPSPPSLTQNLKGDSSSVDVGKRGYPIATSSKPVIERTYTEEDPAREGVVFVPKGPGVELPASEQAILTVLAQSQPRKITAIKAAIIAGYRPTSGGVAAALARLRSKEYISGTGNALSITQLGVNALGPYQVLPTGAALVDWWSRNLSSSEGRMLRYLYDLYPKSASNDEIAQALGYKPTSGGVAAALAKLRALELISGPGSANSINIDLFQ